MTDGWLGTGAKDRPLLDAVLLGSKRRMMCVGVEDVQGLRELLWGRTWWGERVALGAVCGRQGEMVVRCSLLRALSGPRYVLARPAEALDVSAVVNDGVSWVVVDGASEAAERTVESAVKWGVPVWHRPGIVGKRGVIREYPAWITGGMGS